MFGRRVVFPPSSQALGNCLERHGKPSLSDAHKTTKRGRLMKTITNVNNVRAENEPAIPERALDKEVRKSGTGKRWTASE